MLWIKLISSLIGIIMVHIPLTTFSACDAPVPFAYGISSGAANYATKGRSSLDENGILVFDYGTAYNSLGKWHNPFFIARYAQALYVDWYKGECQDDTLKAAFLNQAQFLLSIHQEEKEGMAYWTYPFENSYYGVGSGWISGIGQSNIAGVLIRAFELTGDKNFKSVAKKAMEVYFHDTSSGGVVTESERGLWIQEVPSPDGRAFNILNGHISGLLGVLDVAKLTDDQRLYDIVDRSISAVSNHLPEFDAGFSSFYSLDIKDGSPPKIAPLGGYNNLHISQLKQLYEITGKKNFMDFASLFQEYENIKDERIAKGSTNPKFGPAEAAGYYGTRFWSHNDFPTWYEVHLGKAELLDGIFISGYILKATPREFTVSIFIGDTWSEIYRTSNNEQKEIFISFNRPLATSKIRLNIISDNGNKNVALNAVMPIRSLKNGDFSSITPLFSLSELKPGFRLKDN